MGLSQAQSPRHLLTLAAVQSQLRFFCGAEEFRGQMAADVRRAMEHEPDLILFPEDIGTGLVGLGCRWVSRASSFEAAMLILMLRHPHRALRWLVRPGVSVPRSLLLALADRMRKAYVTTFSALAAEHSVFIAAGSALLPVEGHRSGDVYNTFSLFGPDGSILDTARKVNLIDVEAGQGLDLTPGPRDELHVWHTPIGSFAPLICYDAWDAELVARLVAEGAQMLLVPSANYAAWTDEELVERKRGMYSRVAELGVPGAEAFAVGELAGMTFEGQSWIVTPDPTEPEGVRTVARATSATEPEVIAAVVELPQRNGAASAE